MGICPQLSQPYVGTQCPMVSHSFTCRPTEEHIKEQKQFAKTLCSALCYLWMLSFICYHFVGSAKCTNYSSEFVFFLLNPNVEKSSVNPRLPITSQYQLLLYLPMFGQYSNGNSQPNSVPHFGESRWMYQVKNGRNLNLDQHFSSNFYTHTLWHSQRCLLQTDGQISLPNNSH